jgi:pimeloyl-ACP methyl ester carboxylesterase
MATLNRMITASKTASSQRLARVTIPAVVIMGTKDRDFPNPEAEARFVAEHLGRPATYHMIEGAGHYPYSEMPEVTTPIILNFLASVQAGAAHGA